MGNNKQYKLDNITYIAESIGSLASELNRLNDVELTKAISMVHTSSYCLGIEEGFEISLITERVYKIICYLNGLVPSESYDESHDNQALNYVLEVFWKVCIELECRSYVLDVYFKEKNLYNLLMRFHGENAKEDLNFEDKAYEILRTIRDSNVVCNIPSASKKDYVMFLTPSTGFMKDGIIKFVIRKPEVLQDLGNVVFDSNNRTVRWEGKTLESEQSKELVNVVTRHLCAVIKGAGGWKNIPFIGLVVLPHDIGNMFDSEVRELPQKTVERIIDEIRHRTKGYNPVNIRCSGLVPRWKRFSNLYAYVFTVEVPEVELTYRLQDLGGKTEDYIRTDISTKVSDVLYEFLDSGDKFVYTEVKFV